MSGAKSLKRARPTSPRDDDHARSRPARRRRVDPKEVPVINALSAAGRSRTTRKHHTTGRSSKRSERRVVRAGPAPRTLVPADDSSSDDGEDELELAGLETDLLASSPASGHKLPIQAQFPRGGSLEGLGRKLDLPPASGTSRGKTFLPFNLPPVIRGPATIPAQHPSHFHHSQFQPQSQPHLNRAFSTPRKISNSRSFAGETTEEEQESGDENGSEILSEIEEENREYYKEREQALRRQEKGKGVERMRLLPSAMQKRTLDMQDRRLQPTVSDVTTSLKMLGSPVLIRSIPKRYLPPSSSSVFASYGSPASGSSSPGSSGYGVEEAEIERELLMDVDGASSSEQEQEEEREEKFISSMMLAGDSSDEAEDVETMQLPLADSVRLEHQSRITAMCLPTAESFSGQRVRRLVRARQLGVVVRDLGSTMSMSFARLVAVKRRGTWNAAKVLAGKTIRQELVESRSRLAGSHGSGYDASMLRDAMRRASERRSLMARYRVGATQSGFDSTWASGTLTSWWTTLGRVEPFRSFMLYAQTEPMVRALWLLEREMLEERHVDVILPIESAGSSTGPTSPASHDEVSDDTVVAVSKRRVYTDGRHLAGHEALYPEFIERYVSRLGETEPRFHQLRAWQSIDAKWEARFAAQEEKETRRAVEHRRRTAERARQREDAERRVRETREMEEREALMRAAQIARWEAEAEQTRLRRVEEAAARRQAETFTATMAARTSVERERAMVRNPDPPTYPAVAIQPAAPAAPLPVTPPRAAAPLELPNYSRIEYGNRSPPPPPPYNAVGGFELVEIDDLLFDDDDDEEDQEEEDDDTGPAWEAMIPAAERYEEHTGPVPQAAQPRILSLEEMRAEQAVYEQAERGQTQANTSTGGRCVIM